MRGDVTALKRMLSLPRRANKVEGKNDGERLQVQEEARDGSRKLILWEVAIGERGGGGWHGIWQVKSMTWDNEVRSKITSHSSESSSKYNKHKNKFYKKSLKKFKNNQKQECHSLWWRADVTTAITSRWRTSAQFPPQLTRAKTRREKDENSQDLARHECDVITQNLSENEGTWHKE